jgi:hypothetical protein
LASLGATMKLEVSPSGRASCRGCKKPVPKGELRFAESYALPGADAEGFRYWHLMCAAQKVPGNLKTALAAYDGDVPDRAALDAAMAKGPSKAGDRPLPHVDRAPTGRARCMVCDVAIEKGSYRIAVEREVDTGSFITKGPGYLHPKCTLAWTQENLEDNTDVAGWMQTLFTNSGSSQAEIAELTGMLTPG